MASSLQRQPPLEPVDQPYRSTPAPEAPPSQVHTASPDPAVVEQHWCTSLETAAVRSRGRTSKVNGGAELSSSVVTEVEEAAEDGRGPIGPMKGSPARACFGRCAAMSHTMVPLRLLKGRLS
ncbi:hypothetical protein ARMSODRAFT_966561 [Armillaria solidipes]|uniref:Uncharacterized protein n=1 Tax=Armillaria solidipes TaxID=1076256 RepID=A0A2H3BA52_9AGAR|nr:hypothetical protein ARMSODRAFT_966561 [Armillaria solidipes]